MTQHSEHTHNKRKLHVWVHTPTKGGRKSLISYNDPTKGTRPLSDIHHKRPSRGNSKSKKDLSIPRTLPQKQKQPRSGAADLPRPPAGRTVTQRGADIGAGARARRRAVGQRERHRRHRRDP